MTSSIQPSRRFSLVALILVVVATSITAAAPPGSGGSASGLTTAESSLVGPATVGAEGLTPGFGFMVLFSTSGRGPSLDDFKKDIDLLVANGQKWVRLGIVGWDIMEVADPGRQIIWDEEALKQYDAAIDYVNSKGLAIHLITADAENNPATSFDDYKVTLGQFWDTLARRFANKVAVWQVYSESDTAHFRLLSQPVEDLTPEYLSDLGSMLAIARATIKAVNPRVLLTTTSTGWPMSDERQARWQKYFDGISQYLDVISLDVYPADSFVEIEMLPKRINDTKLRYGKPVIIAEVGLQVAGKWSSEDQRLFVPAAIAAAKQARPLAIIVYQLRDDGSNAFGLIGENWAPRPGFTAAIQVMRY
ncbi:hypothetical protein [Arthrobacter sp. ISL-69]|uniref:hypothetical protein n=1 Tax=Arthrobacter sp. ISL-69 TaxID=2819113 RepID=UPI001BE7CA4C|nr:hypothetical protein [Arthrobacter sp. ISL-69]MBT2535304.1 hypothetical protein [Arthrobacter sp. ISL-69]